MRSELRPHRRALFAVLNDMPSEAFSWLLLSISGQHGQVWPDGIGGFSHESQQSIEKTKAVAEHLLDTHHEDV